MSEPVRKPNQTSPESYSPKNKPELLGMVEKAAHHQQQDHLTENILRGIPPMGYGNPSAVCYIGSVIRLMHYLNDPIEADELFALSGTALCFPWKTGLCCDEVSILPEIPQRTFEALGYASEYIYEPNISIEPYSLITTREMINGQPKMTIRPHQYSKEFYINKIRTAIDSGRPVIGFGFTELNFTCLITGYRHGGAGLTLRAYWSPHSEPEGYGGEDHYYYTENWYEKCCGLVIVGEKTGERLTGAQAYEYLQKTAKIMCEKETAYTQGEVIYNNNAAFDDMVRWLLNDDWWREGFDTANREMYLKSCGLLLVDYYRSHLRGYLQKMDKQYPGIVHQSVMTVLEQFGKSFPGHEHSTLYLHECIDPALADFSLMRDRALREKVAAYVECLQQMDQELFDGLIGTEGMEP